jgi:hypothetical protein
LFDCREIGGQFNLARRIPGKENSPKRCAISACGWVCSA